MKTPMVCALAVLILTWCAGIISAQTRERLRFARGTTQASVKGVVRGFAYHDYVVHAGAGQKIDTNLSGGPLSPVFTILLPGGANLEGAAEMNDFEGSLPKSGDYTIRVLMMRSAARRMNSVSNFTLRVSIK